MSKLYLNSIKERLNSEIKGAVSIHVVDDLLIVDIYHHGSITWHYTMPNVSIKLSSYIQSKIVADTIIDRYRTFILDKYFFSKKVKIKLDFSSKNMYNYNCR